MLAPGAQTARAGYEIVSPSDVSPVPAPGDLIERCGSVEQKGSSTSGSTAGLDSLDRPENVEKAAEWLIREVQQDRVAISGQGGNDFTYRTAEVVRDHGVSEDVAKKLLLEHWNPHCDPPWSDDELGQIVANAYQYAKRPAGTRVTPDPASLDEMVRLEAELHGDNSKPNPYRLRPRNEWSTMRDPEWLVQDTLPERSLAIAYGSPGSFKSFVIFDMVARLSLGNPWAGHAAHGPGQVAVVAGEGSAGFRRRMEAIETEIGQEAPGVFLVDTMPPFANDNALKLFNEALRAAKPLKAIVLDTTAHAMAGLDENSAADAGHFLYRCLQLIRAHDCALVLVSHAGKDERRGIRGSSAFRAAADVVLRFDQQGERSTRITMEKQKDAEPWAKEQWFTLEPRANSLAPVPTTADDALPSRHDVLAATRFMTARAVLELAETELTTLELADLMVAESEPKLDAEARKKRTLSIKDWLNTRVKDEDGRALDLLADPLASPSSRTWRLPIN